MLVTLVVAMDEAGTIGLDGGLPWRLPADLRHFRRVTMGHPVIMGRRTWESIGRPLPGRTNVVITRAAGFEAAGALVVSSPEEALEVAERSGAEEAMIIGGAQVYGLFLPRADRIQLTRIHARVAGDTVFPPLEEGAWVEVSRRRREADEKNPHAMSFVVLDRRRAEGP